MLDGISIRVSDGVSTWVSDGVSTRVSDCVSTWVLGGVSTLVSDYVSTWVSDGVVSDGISTQAKSQLKGYVFRSHIFLHNANYL